ncbi:MAG: ribonuclease HII [Treponema lecithinolyticum]|uniref:ribonuclease HII n=1 Tax=Treponema lecithinolyticum TaxID=53418 RepID=UPI003FA20831
MLVCGLDEAGRGPLAGPVTAGAVFLNDDFPVALLNDSKKLSAKKREALEVLIKEQALSWAVASVNEKEIDRINILQASLAAMKQAFERALQKLPDEKRRCAEIECIADGLFCPDIASEYELCAGMYPAAVHCSARVRADSCVPSVMAASILAKTERDRIMCAYARLYPQYGYERHKGYPTAEHRKICRSLGPSPIQRMTFSY